MTISPGMYLELSRTSFKPFFGGENAYAADYFQKEVASWMFDATDFSFFLHRILLPFFYLLQLHNFKEMLNF